MVSNFKFYLEDKIAKLEAGKGFLDYNYPFEDNYVNKYCIFIKIINNFCHKLKEKNSKLKGNI